MEQSNPQSELGQDDATIMSRMTSFLTQFDENQASGSEAPRQEQRPSEPQPPKAAEQSEEQAQSDEPTVDDLPSDPAQAQSPVEDAFEIVHNGAQVKLTRADTIKYAQQGFDYDRKTQAVAEQRKDFEVRLERLAALEGIAPQVQQEFAQVKALEGQLAPWQNVNWVEISEREPENYARYRAQFDSLVHQWQRASWQFQQKSQAFEAERSQLSQQALRDEYEALLERLPDMRDEGKAKAIKSTTVDYLRSKNVPERLLVDINGSAAGFEMAYKAAKYDELLRSKRDKVKQLRDAPPVGKPNAAQGAAAQSTERQKQLDDRLKRSGDVKDGVRALLNRWQ